MQFKLELVSVLAMLTMAVDAQVALWGQCGGIGYSGATNCVSGSVCTKMNDYYSQCVPGTGTTSVPSGTTSVSTPSTPAPTSSAKFTNPIRTKNGSDPHMVYHDGYYYLTATTWSNIQIARARTINELKTATWTTVWQDTNASRCCNVWAPEMHLINGRWYIYYTAGPKGDQYGTTQRTWVIQGGVNHPMEPYTFLSEINVGIPNLDPSVYKIGSKNYYLFSAWPQEGQSVYIAELLTPSRIGPITRISSPTLSWETKQWAVNEGPIGLTGPTGRNFIFFSGSACASQYYSLGYLELTPGANPLLASSWKKNQNVQFATGNGMYGPGHNGFFKSPSGKEDWIVYHANTAATGTCDGNRRTEIQKIGWNSDGTPNLGRPIGENVPIAEPL